MEAGNDSFGIGFVVAYKDRFRCSV